MLLSSVFLDITLKREWTHKREGCIYGYNSGTVVENVADMVACQFLCENSDIICLSVNYEHVEKKCRFNSADTSTRGISSTSSCYRYGGYYSYNLHFSEPVRSKLIISNKFIFFIFLTLFLNYHFSKMDHSYNRHLYNGRYSY